MARRGFARRGGIKPPQRQINNLAISGDVDGLATIIGIVKAVGSLGINTLESSTVVRTRGEFTVRVAAAVAGDNIIRGAFGIIIVSTDAFGVGITALPGPLSDSENDWYVWAPFSMAFDNVLTEFDSKWISTVVFDSRGMRKLKVGDVSAVMFEVESDVAGNSIDMGYSFREQAKG